MLGIYPSQMYATRPILTARPTTITPNTMLAPKLDRQIHTKAILFEAT